MTPRIRSVFLIAASVATLQPYSLAQLSAQDVGPAPADVAPAPVPEGMEVMTRGVVHEAFAEVVTDPKPGLVVSKKPPEAIEEVPPEFKPEEDGAIWITGYWAWDDERDDFFWQSGVWRVPPPGMRWVAGYWNAAPRGWQWVSGFWVPVATEEVRYYDAPPASLEAGPTSPSPGDDYFWATGSWNYYDTGYRWQPGYWAPYQENWVWISPRYVWTPAGCVYLAGRWDYRLTRRGCLFAPIYFTQPIYTQPNYVYRPWCALNTPNLFVHLWVRPNYGHFYFGNYYGSNWNTWGVTPWAQYRPYRNCYDPMLTQLQCHYRQQGVNYINRLDGWHNHYASNVSARPPRTWNEQVRYVANTNININKTNITNITNIKQNILAVNLQDSKRRNEMPVRFAQLDSKMQKQAFDLAKETRDVRQHRISTERPDGNLPDLAKKDFGKREVGRPEIGNPDSGKDLPGKSGPRAGRNEQVRMKLPATKVSEIAKEYEKLAPPKLTRPNPSQPRVDGRTDLDKNRDDGRGSFSGSKGKGFNPKPRGELPDELPKGLLPKDEGKPEPRDPRPRPRLEGTDPEVPRVKLPQPRPKVEAPQPKPRVETPKPEPKVEVPQPKPKPRVEGPMPKPRNENPMPRPRGDNPIPKPRNDNPMPKPRGDNPMPKPRNDNPMPKPRLENPQPKIEIPRSKAETPREQPQIKLDIPRSNPKPDANPRRGGENKPRGDRKKPE